VYQKRQARPTIWRRFNLIKHKQLFKKMYFYFLQLFLITDFYSTVHNYSSNELIFSDTKTDCLAKGRLSDKQNSV